VSPFNKPIFSDVFSSEDKMVLGHLRKPSPLSDL